MPARVCCGTAATSLHLIPFEGVRSAQAQIQSEGSRVGFWRDFIWRNHRALKLKTRHFRVCRASERASKTNKNSKPNKKRRNSISSPLAGQWRGACPSDNREKVARWSPWCKTVAIGSGLIMLAGAQLGIAFWIIMRSRNWTQGGRGGGGWRQHWVSK